MGLILLVLLVVAPLVELFVIVQVAIAIGVWETIALLVVESLIGFWLLKRQGLSTLSRIGQEVDAGRVPGKDMADGVLILVAGVLILLPGFVGDVIGFLLLVPPIRALVRIPIMRRAEASGQSRFFTTVGSVSGTRFVGTFRAGSVVDVTGRESSTNTPGDPDGRRELEG